MQDLNDMLLFAEVVERGGFAAAGRALGMPKSRLSRRVAGLEAQLGVRLLQRTTRKLSLTEVGETFLRHCQAMRESAQAAADVVANAQTEPRGTIRVVCPVTLAQTVLADVMPIYLARHPQMRVEMEVNNRVVDLVKEGVDVALRVRLSLEESGSLVIKRLDDARSVLVASPALLERQGTPVTLEEASQLDSVAMSATDGQVSVRLTHTQGREATLHRRRSAHPEARRAGRQRHVLAARLHVRRRVARRPPDAPAAGMVHAGGRGARGVSFPPGSVTGGAQLSGLSGRIRAGVRQPAASGATVKARE